MGHESKFTFVDEQGRRVKGRRWKNPDGSVGGWVAANAYVHPTAFVDVDALVEPRARVGENKRLAAGEVMVVVVQTGN